jgi:hypothetical protein
MLLQNQDLNSGAGEQIPSIIPAGPPPAIQHYSRPLDTWAPRREAVILSGRPLDLALPVDLQLEIASVQRR